MADKKTKAKSKKIVMSKLEFSNLYDQINVWMVKIASVFEKDNPKRISIIKDKNKRESYIYEKLTKCVEGWRNASPSLNKRLKIVFHFDPAMPDHYYLSEENRFVSLDDVGTAKLSEDRVDKDAVNVIKAGNSKEIMDTIYEEIVNNNRLEDIEKKRVYTRVKKMYETFPFNDSSDRELIINLIYAYLRRDRLNKKFLDELNVDTTASANNAIKDVTKMILDTQKALGMSTEQRRSFETQEMTFQDQLDFFNEEVKDFEGIVTNGIEEMIVMVRAWQCGKIHESMLKNNFGLTLEEILAGIDAHCLITDDDGKIMKPKEFKKYLKYKASEISRKTLKDYGLDMTEDN